MDVIAALSAALHPRILSRHRPAGGESVRVESANLLAQPRHARHRHLTPWLPSRPLQFPPMGPHHRPRLTHNEYREVKAPGNAEALHKQRPGGLAIRGEGQEPDVQ